MFPITGVRGVAEQDAMIQDSQGRIADRTREHLSASDAAIVRFRRTMLVGRQGAPVGHRAASAVSPFELQVAVGKLDCIGRRDLRAGHDRKVWPPLRPGAVAAREPAGLDRSTRDRCRKRSMDKDRRHDANAYDQNDHQLHDVRGRACAATSAALAQSYPREADQDGRSLCGRGLDRPDGEARRQVPSVHGLASRWWWRTAPVPADRSVMRWLPTHRQTVIRCSSVPPAP